jgi:hypothetical protein
MNHSKANGKQGNSDHGQKKMSLLERIERAKREIQFLEAGGYGEAPSWLYLLGWADWKMELLHLESQRMPRLRQEEEEKMDRNNRSK